MKIVNLHEKPLFVGVPGEETVELAPQNPLVLSEEQVEKGVHISFSKDVRGAALGDVNRGHAASQNIQSGNNKSANQAGSGKK